MAGGSRRGALGRADRPGLGLAALLPGVSSCLVAAPERSAVTAASMRCRSSSESTGEGDAAGTDEPDRASPRTRCGNSLPGSSSAMRVIPPAVRTYGHASARYSGAQDERLFKRDYET